MTMGPADRGRDEGEREFEFLRATRRLLEGDDWGAAMAAKRAMPRFDPAVLAPDPELAREAFPQLLDSRSRHQVRLEPVEDPGGLRSLGMASPTVEVRGEFGQLRVAVLTLPLEPGEAGLLPDTVEVFRFDEDAQAYHRVDPGGVLDGSVAWARVAGPGRYVAAGLPADPLVLRTVTVMHELRDLLRVAPREVRAGIQERICQLILCAPDFADRRLEEAPFRALVEGLAAEGFPEPPTGWGEPGPGPGMGVCERCLDLGRWPFLPPEVGLVPDHRLPGLRWPDRWRPPFRRCQSAWTSMGPVDWWEDPASPNRLSGCCVDLALHPGSADRLLAATSNGGLWRLGNARAIGAPDWRPLTDFNDSLGLACVAVAPSDPGVVYLSQEPGWRVVRSDDGGWSWAATGSAAAGLGDVRRILVHPTDARVVVAATSNGVWTSADRGATWTRRQAGDYLDAAMDPDDARILYAGEHLVGLHKTADFGASWTPCLAWGAVAGTGSSNMIQVALGRRGTDATRTVVVKFGEIVVVNRNGGRPPGVPGGGPWTTRPLPGGPGDRNGYGYWCHAVAVDPFDDDVILAGAQRLWRTADGGASWVEVASFYSPHEDQHAVVFDPRVPGLAWLANDGGVFRSTDGGRTWHQRNVGLVTAQFYRVGIAGNRGVGNTYHSGIIASEALNGGGWANVEGHAWEFANVWGDPRRPNSFYVLAGELCRLRVPKLTPTDFQIPWGTPSFRPATVAVDQRPASATILAGADNPGRVMRTLTGDAASPSWAAEPGISVTGDAVTGLAFANPASGLAYAITGGGRLFSKADVNAAGPWTALGQWMGTGRVVGLAVNPQVPGRVYAASGATIQRFDAAAGTWTPITGAAPNALPASTINNIVTHPGNGTVLFAGLHIGVFVSYDEGGTWYPFDEGLPNAPVLEIQWATGFLYATTHGRGLWRRAWPP
jgi:hypothetical protein